MKCLTGYLIEGIHDTNTLLKIGDEKQILYYCGDIYAELNLTNPTYLKSVRKNK